MRSRYGYHRCAKVFPIKLNRKDLYQRLADIKYLRNRIAHHERIMGRMCQQYANLLEAIRWLSPDMEAWVKATNCFEERWAKKMIVPKPKPQLPIPAAPGCCRAERSRLTFSNCTTTFAGRLSLANPVC